MAYPDTVASAHFLKFAHKLFKGVVRDEARVPVRVELDEITKVLHLSCCSKHNKFII